MAYGTPRRVPIVFTFTIFPWLTGHSLSSNGSSRLVLSCGVVPCVVFYLYFLTLEVPLGPSAVGARPRLALPQPLELPSPDQRRAQPAARQAHGRGGREVLEGASRKSDRKPRQRTIKELTTRWSHAEGGRGSTEGGSRCLHGTCNRSGPCCRFSGWHISTAARDPRCPHGTCNRSWPCCRSSGWHISTAAQDPRCLHGTCNRSRWYPYQVHVCAAGHVQPGHLAARLVSHLVTDPPSYLPEADRNVHRRAPESREGPVICGARIFLFLGTGLVISLWDVGHLLEQVEQLEKKAIRQACWPLWLESGRLWNCPPAQDQLVFRGHAAASASTSSGKISRDHLEQDHPGYWKAITQEKHWNACSPRRGASRRERRRRRPRPSNRTVTSCAGHAR